jgi:beta-glucanase (GH16 family)
MKKRSITLRLAVGFLLASLVLTVQPGHAQIGEVIWEENFDDLDNWMIITGNGAWGWGNGELEFYHENNVEIAGVPGEPGNNALLITARQETEPEFVDQWGNPLNYTSGKVSTKAKVSVQYGVIETRVRVPDLDLGGWPAVWMLGTANYTWPRCGELDVMELGATQEFRNLHDEHNGGNGADNSTVNQMAMANALFFSEDAITPENPSGAHSLSWDPDDEYCRPYYNYDTPLNDRFVTYRMYWDEESVRFTILDDGDEFDLYASPFAIDSTSLEFRQPFYLIANLAIGGVFTDAYNLGDPGSGAPVSMPFPAEMYVDYIKVMEWNQQGEVHIGPPTFQGGTYGIFTDLTPTDNGLAVGEDAEIYVWEGTLSEGTIPPYEGENGITWVSNGLGWFGAGIMSAQPTNLFNFGEGNLKFMINIPSAITFQIGIIDAWGNQSYVEFPAHQTTYGLVRDGNWGQASIPISDIRGEWIDLRMLSYEFVILEVNGAGCEFALDDIYWDGGGEVGVIEYEVETPTEFRLDDAYPNPFNPTTNLRVSLPRSGDLNVSVFNVNGRHVATLTSGIHSAGSHMLTFDASDLASGLYFVRAQVPGQLDQTQKVMLVR